MNMRSRKWDNPRSNWQRTRKPEIVTINQTTTVYIIIRAPWSIRKNYEYIPMIVVNGKGHALVNGKVLEDPIDLSQCSFERMGNCSISGSQYSALHINFSKLRKMGNIIHLFNRCSEVGRYVFAITNDYSTFEVEMIGRRRCTVRWNGNVTTISANIAGALAIHFMGYSPKYHEELFNDAWRIFTEEVR